MFHGKFFSVVPASRRSSSLAHESAISIRSNDCGSDYVMSDYYDDCVLSQVIWSIRLHLLMKVLWSQRLAVLALCSYRARRTPSPSARWEKRPRTRCSLSSTSTATESACLSSVSAPCLHSTPLCLQLSTFSFSVFTLCSLLTRYYFFPSSLVHLPLFSLVSHSFACMDFLLKILVSATAHVIFDTFSDNFNTSL